MSKRPIEAKKRRRVAKALRRRELPAYFDIIQWLLDHDYANTKRGACDIILAKRVRANSHILGVEERPVARQGPLGIVKIETKEVVNSLVRADLRDDIVVLSK